MRTWNSSVYLDNQRAGRGRRGLAALCMALALCLLAGLPAPGALRAASVECAPRQTPDLATGNYRYATAQDVATIPNASIGDYIIDGYTTPSASQIYISTAPNWNNSFALGPGKKILIKGGYYTQILLDIPNVVGSAQSPVVITNYGGKVSTRELTILGARHFKLTGRYSLTNKTGDPGFLGWETAQPYYQGQFGFDLRNGWVSTTGSELKIGGNASDYEVEYVEAGDGGFAGMLLKTDNGSVDMLNVKIHHNYIHDTDGEGIYLGSTQADPEHQFRHLRIYDNVIARAGLNTLQTGQLSDDVIIENNVLIMGAINWKNPFQRFQDSAIQLSLRRGSTIFRNNLVIGGGGLLVSAFVQPKAGLAPSAGAPFIIENNLFLANQSKTAIYAESRGDSVTPWILRNNYIGQLNDRYSIVYTGAPDTWPVMWAGYNGTTAQMSATGNRFDASAVAPYVRKNGTAQLSASDNLLGTVPLPDFVNFMELPPSFSYSTIEKWNSVVGESLPITGTNKGDPIVYAMGDLVMHNGELYRSKQNDNTNHQPQASSDAWWELVTFPSTGGTTCIPDDVRLYRDDFYALRNIGLHSTLAPDAWPRHYLPLVRGG